MEEEVVEKDEFSEGWDEAETPTEEPETEEKEAEKPEETPSEEPEGDEEKPEKEEPAPTPKGEEKPWYEADATLSEEVRQKIRSFNGMYVSERKKREELEAENERLKTPPKEEPKKDEPAAYDFEVAEDHYMDALIDGDKETAKNIRKEIEVNRKEAWLEEAERKTKRSLKDEKEQESREVIERDLTEVATMAYEKYPFLNPEADLVNNRAIREIKAKRNEYYNSGMPIKEALQKAVDEIGPQYLKTANLDKHKKMEAVKTRSTPVLGGGKGRADKNDFEGAWDEA